MHGLKGKTALVTGSASGIGKACALALAKRGADLIINGRSPDAVGSLAGDIAKTCGVKATPAIFDVRDRKKLADALKPVLEREKVDILVNNAGLALGLEKLHEGDMDDWDTMIDTNVKGLLYVTKLVVADMVRRGVPGLVINIGSLAGMAAYPNGAVYCATKAAVKMISDGLRLDLVDTPIRVTNIAPGMAETNFSETRFHGDRERAEKVYRGIKPLSAEDVAGCVAFVACLPDHVEIHDLVLTPVHQSSGNLVWRDGS